MSLFKALRVASRTQRSVRQFSAYTGLNADETELREAVRDFAKREIAPIAAQIDK